MFEKPKIKEREGEGMSRDLCTVRLFDDDTIAVIELNDPPTANAMSPEMGDAFREAMHRLARSEKLRAAIIRGAGKNFSIGGPRNMLSMLSSDSMDKEARHAFMLDYYERWLSVLEVKIPIIAAIEGECIGVAPAFAFLSDIALADETAHFEITFTNLGLYPGMALPKLVPEMIGRQRAGLIMLAAAPFSGAEAARLGVVSRAVPMGTVHDAALALARRIVDAAPETIRQVVETLRPRREDLASELEKNADAQAESYASAEFRQRIARYLPDHYQQ